MRLICPNCGAQYEVDASMIPPEGRDVQCSNCAHTWMQAPEGAPMRLDDPVVAPAPEPVPDPEPAVTEAADPGVAPEPAAFEETLESRFDAAVDDQGSEPPDEVPDADDGPLPQDAMAPRKPSEQLDERVLGILREEAEREAEARRQDAAALETQPDLGIDSAPAAPRAAAATAAAVTAGARDEMMPDLDRINSSLRPAADHPEVQEMPDPAVIEAQERKGFRWGFTLIIVIVALMILAYAFAPQLAEQVPALEPALTQYVGAANALADMIDGYMAQLSGSEDAAQ